VERIALIPAVGNHAVVGPQHVAGIQTKLQEVLGASEFAIQSIHGDGLVFAGGRRSRNGISHSDRLSNSLSLHYEYDVQSQSF
jgi:hypothetical protein